MCGLSFAVEAHTFIRLVIFSLRFLPDTSIVCVSTRDFMGMASSVDELATSVDSSKLGKRLSLKLSFLPTGSALSPPASRRKHGKIEYLHDDAAGRIHE